MRIQTEYTWYTIPQYRYWHRVILGRLSNFFPEPTCTVNSDIWNCVYFARPLDTFRKDYDISYLEAFTLTYTWRSGCKKVCIQTVAHEQNVCIQNVTYMSKTYAYKLSHVSKMYAYKLSHMSTMYAYKLSHMSKMYAHKLLHMSKLYPYKLSHMSNIYAYKLSHMSKMYAYHLPFTTRVSFTP